MITLALDRYQTLAVAVGVLYLGSLMKKKISVLERFCIPAPVAGGLVFSLLTCILYATGTMQITFDDSLREVAMVFFFTSVGFMANVKILREGGKDLLIFLILIIILIVAQNGIAVGMAGALGLDALVGMCTGSVPMVGGHGTAGAFGPVFEDFGVNGATTICTAAATFGLIMGSLIGGPIGNSLIRKKGLKPIEAEKKTGKAALEAIVTDKNYPQAVFLLVICAGIGTIVSSLLSRTGMTFPVYIGAMLVAAIVRNVAEFTSLIEIPTAAVDNFGSICLNLFLGIAMITLKIWQLADLAGPLVLLLIGQTVFMFLFARYVIYFFMGRDFDAAVMAAGVCGFGMGATPNAMANMQAVTDKNGPSVKAYLLIPIVGSLFADFINSLVITFFINMV